MSFGQAYPFNREKGAATRVVTAPTQSALSRLTGLSPIPPFVAVPASMPVAVRVNIYPCPIVVVRVVVIVIVRIVSVRVRVSWISVNWTAHRYSESHCSIGLRRVDDGQHSGKGKCRDSDRSKGSFQHCPALLSEELRCLALHRVRCSSGGQDFVCDQTKASQRQLPARAKGCFLTASCAPCLPKSRRSSLKRPPASGCRRLARWLCPGSRCG